jgi:hypothetical protein
VLDGGLSLFPFVEDGVQVNHLALTQRFLRIFKIKNREDFFVHHTFTISEKRWISHCLHSMQRVKLFNMIPLSGKNTMFGAGHSVYVDQNWRRRFVVSKSRSGFLRPSECFFGASAH